ncbi:MAG: IDEAL domain-containing protein [Caldibacillus debilis]|jgi:uncharacterized protein YpiB (UPF0302 family)|nr:IDEAL domain-containing protein [Bacillaceae bacterium]OUM86597.1 MAG: hypothetical protein BAA03_03940 [Caldibacillus debilis]MBY6271186.1 IDEAL domain-containing protein [Bacillaceae bacterium]REJ15092.1 MAG: IDEAL domain-containing protein [Caldibacillus debilis]REJ28080.1 MAG: IDEAL domain-containing protein [Caldibacillus debilis]
MAMPAREELNGALALTRQKDKEKGVEAIYIDILINEALLKEKKEKLKQKIDQALDRNDREAFMELSARLREVEKELNA